MYPTRYYLFSLILIGLLITTIVIHPANLFRAASVFAQEGDAETDGEDESAADENVESENPQDSNAVEKTLKGPIVVGSRDFTEQLILGHLIIVALEEAGFEVIDQTGLGGTNSAHDAIKAGEVDIIWDYIGTILSESHGVPPIGLPTDLATGFQMVAALDARHHDLLWLTPTPFNDTYTLMIEPTALAAKTGEVLKSIDDLAAYMEANDAPLSVCVENEFYSRGDGLYSLQEHYGFAFLEENIQIVAYDQLYEGLRDGLCDVAEGFSTDGRISAWGFQNLDDSASFFPAYNASPIVRAETVSTYPEINEILNGISSLLDNATIAALNAEVDIGADGERGSGDEETIRDVVVRFLQENNLIEQIEEPGPVITVGSRDFTEQLILGQIIVVLLEDAGFDVVDKTGLGGTNSAHDAIKAGEVDIIWDYIGTILSESHGIPPIGLPADTDTALEMVRGLDAHHHDLVWLEPTVFNDTYTLMIKPDVIEEKTGIPLRSIEDLADYQNVNDEPLSICVENEFYSRGDGLYAMKEHYDFTFAEENIQIVAYDQLYEGLRDGLCDVAEGFSTDGRISSWGFQNLADSQLFFPAYNASPIVRRELLADHPEVSEMLNRLGALLDNGTITVLNARVDLGADGERSSGDEETVREVAHDFLRQNRLLTPPKISVGSRDFTEQLLLGQILIGALELSGFSAVDKTGLGGTNSAHNAVKEGEVDIIWDYIGTILSESHGVPPIGLPADTDTALKMVRGLDAHHHNLVWLEPTAFNDTYTLMIKPDELEEKTDQRFTSIDDLAAYMNETESPLTICVENEFYSRGDGLYSLQDHYGFAFDEANIQIVAYDQLYEGLRDGLCDVAEGFSTDGRISAWSFQNLEDSRQFFPAYNASPIVRSEIIESYPEIAEALNQLSQILDNETIAALNARIDIGEDGERNSGDEESVEEVAMSFLAGTPLAQSHVSVIVEESEAASVNSDDESTDAQENSTPPSQEEVEAKEEETAVSSSSEDSNVSTGPEEEPEASELNAASSNEDDTEAANDESVTGETDGEQESANPNDEADNSTLPDENAILNNELLKQDFVVASTIEPAQILLGHMVAALLQELGIPVVREMGRGTSQELRIALDNQEVDLYTDFSADALITVHRLPESTLPRNTSEVFSLVNNLDQPEGIVWFTPLEIGDEFPSATVTRQEILQSAPGLENYIARIRDVVTNQVIEDLINQVEVGPDQVQSSGDEISSEDAVRLFLCAQELIATCEDGATKEVEANSAPISQLRLVLLPTSTPTATPNAPPIPTESPTPTPTSPAPTVTPQPPTVVALPLPTATSDPTAVASSNLTSQNQGQSYITVPATFSVNARATTSIDAPVVQILERGKTYSALGRTSDSEWIQVQFDDQQVWVYTEAIYYSAGLLERLPVVTP